MPVLADLIRGFKNGRSAWGGNTGSPFDATKQKPLGMPGGVPGYTAAGGDSTRGNTGIVPPGTGGIKPAPDDTRMYAGGSPTFDERGPQGWQTGGGDPRMANPPMMPPINYGTEVPPQGTGAPSHPGMGNQRPTPRPAYVPGSNPATANQGYTAADFYNGKAGFGAGWSGAEKQEWLQNNMAPITGHNYLVDTTAHNANVQARLGANNAAAMGKMQANPAFAQLQNGPSTGADAGQGQGNYVERNGGMYGTGMSRSAFNEALRTGDPTVMAQVKQWQANQSNPAYWQAKIAAGENVPDWAKAVADGTWSGPGGQGTPTTPGTPGNPFGV